MNDLYKRINEICKQKGLSPNSCAKLAGISPTILYDIKQGKKEGISRKSAEKIAAVLGVSVEDFYKTAKEKAPEA